MFSVFFHMSEFMTNVIFSILEKVVLGEKPVFREELHLTFAQPEHGWVLGAIGDYVFAEYRAKNLLFKPRLSILHHTDAVKSMKLQQQQKVSHERVYVTWREAASENFFKDVEALFKRIKKQEES